MFFYINLHWNSHKRTFDSEIFGYSVFFFPLRGWIFFKRHLLSQIFCLTTLIFFCCEGQLFNVVYLEHTVTCWVLVSLQTTHFLHVKGMTHLHTTWPTHQNNNIWKCPPGIRFSSINPTIWRLSFKNWSQSWLRRYF